MKKHPRYASAAAAVIVYAMLGFLLAPWLLEKTLVDSMREDFDADLRVEKIEINPFALSLRINGLELDGPGGEPTARIGEIFANFQLSSIFRLALTFDEIRFTSPELFVARDRAGNLDFTYLVASGDAETGDESPAQESSGPLPLLVFDFAIEDLNVNWADQLPPDPVETRLGPITIAIDELNTIPDRSGQQTVVIATETGGTLRWSGDLQLNPLKSSGQASLEQSGFTVASSYIKHQSGIEIVDGSARVELDYEVTTNSSGKIEARIDNFNLTLQDLALASFADGSGFDFAGEDRKFLEIAAVRLSGGQLRWPANIVSLESIAIDGPRIDVSRDEAGRFSLEPRQLQSSGEQATAGGGESAADQSNQVSPGDEWQVSVGNLAVNGLAVDLLDRSLDPEARFGITDFQLNIRDIGNQPGKRFPTALSLQVLSGGSLSLDGEFSLLPEPAFEFDVNLDAVQLAGAQPYVQQQANLNLDSGALNLDGHVSGNVDEPLSFKGDLAVLDLVVAESIKNKRLAAWKSFRADNIAFSAAAKKLDISRLQFDRLYGDILINEDGSLNVDYIRKADAAAPADEADASASEDEGPAPKISIGQIAVAGAAADFADLSLPLPFAAKIDSLNGNVTTISTESSEPSEISLEGKIDEFGLARVSGMVTPLEPARNTDILLTFENIDMPGFTPYSISFAGRKIQSGKLDLKLGYVVKDNHLEGRNSIVLRDFELGEKVPHPDAMDAPLGLAVALLKDANGKIDIDLPVSGNLDDPDFSYGKVTTAALSGFLTKIVVSPFAALGGMLGVEASELEYVNFPPGRSDLSPPEREKAGKLAEALALRPELQLSVAGVYDSDADTLALRSARLDNALELKIAELSAEGDPEIQYPDLRRMALEQLFSEELAKDTPPPDEQMEQLRQQFTGPVAVEGETEPVPTLDELAYANRLRTRLIEIQALDENELDALASARAAALKTAMLAVDANLQDRILIDGVLPVTREDEGPVPMKVTLSAKSE